MFFNLLEMEEKHFDSKMWATALAMEYIDLKLGSVKPENQKEFDKAKLFLFKAWTDVQNFLKVGFNSNKKILSIEIVIIDTK